MTASPSIILERHGCPLHAWLSGPEHGPLVALTHGATLDHRMWDQQIAPLIDAGYRVLTWDVRGHGQSQPIGEHFTIRGAAADLIALLDHLGVARAAFVGQSMGGNITQELAFYAPERVQAMAMIGCACNTMPLTIFEQFSLRMSGPLLALYSTDTLRRQIARRTAIRPEVRAYSYEAGCQMSKQHFLTVWDALTRCLHYEPRYRITRPLLLSYGAHDHLGNFRHSYPEWARRDTGGAYVIIPDAGHNANQDNPSFFNDLLLDFLRHHVPSAYEPPFAAHTSIG